MPNEERGYAPKKKPDSTSPRPFPSLLKGASAIHGMGEKSNANPVTDSGSTTITIPLGPGRSGFTPALDYGDGHCDELPLDSRTPANSSAQRRLVHEHLPRFERDSPCNHVLLPNRSMDIMQNAEKRSHWISTTLCEVKLV